MILSFGDATTQEAFHGGDSAALRRLDAGILKVVRQKLDLLNAACDLRDLRVPPGNRLEKLAGDLAGRWSIRVNDQWRLIFKWEGGNAYDVQLIDYH